ncbi:hypothetical protein [Bordetella sp. BOR01]|uniref:hypothetical protein n=1 Tax=Bordetella sp. BOR01 TaxID=2854779 RepID=UPI001C484385|nr:hypothetical protein [Bordetella sp. BOR01]MBV7485210.1 hypothetical protein [Bordetella sp. BOR01]
MTNPIPPASSPSLAGVGLDSNSRVQGADLVGADQETAMMTVQTERTRLLDKEIASQIEELRAINRKLELLNEVLSGLKAVQAQFRSSDDYDDEWDDKGDGWSYKLADQINRAAMAADINLGFDSDDNTYRFYTHMSDLDEYATAYMPSGIRLAIIKFRETGMLDPAVLPNYFRDNGSPGGQGFLIPDRPGQAVNRCPGGIRYDSENGEIRKVVTKVTGLVDNLSSVQQDQMVRLQAMLNRRNEAADMTSNYVRKLHESRAGIAEKIRGT